MKKVLTVVASIILWVVILLAAFFAFVTLATKDPTDISKVFGMAMLRVKSDSMKPEFETDDWILIKECDPNELEVGDIITFTAVIETDEGNVLDFNTHRITQIDDSASERIFTTKGDNAETNTVEDKYQVLASSIEGKYIGKVPILGPVLTLLSKPVGFLCCIVLPILAFFIYQIIKLINISAKYRKAVAAEAAQEAAASLDPDSAAAQLAAKEAELEKLRAQLAEKDADKAAEGADTAAEADKE